MAGCLGNGGLPGNGKLPQQWQTTSIGVECLGNGGRPYPTELGHPVLAVLALKLSTPSISNCCLFVFVGVGPAKPDHLAPCLRAPFFFKLNG